MKPKILITQPLPREWWRPLSAFCQVVTSPRPLSSPALIRAVGDIDGLWCFLNDQVDSEVLKAGIRLKVIANCAAGVNNIDLITATRCGIVVANTPDVLTDATADLAWALLLGVTRRIIEGDDFVRSGRFHGWRADLLLGSDLSGKALGIVGFGRIGQAMAKRARGFGMRVLYTDLHRAPPSVEKKYDVTRVTLTRLIKDADVVTLHIPLTLTTRHLIGRRELANMKRTAFLINTSRGPVVDERALAQALACGGLAGAGLDVFEQEPAVASALLKSSHVLLAPHVGSATRETRAKMAELTCQNLLDGLQGRPPRYFVNAEVWPGRAG